MRNQTAKVKRRWWKRNPLSFHFTWLEYFYRFALHHWLFSEAPLELEKFVKQEGAIPLD